MQQTLPPGQLAGPEHERLRPWHCPRGVHVLLPLPGANAMQQSCEFASHVVFPHVIGTGTGPPEVLEPLEPLELLEPPEAPELPPDVLEPPELPELLDVEVPELPEPPEELAPPELTLPRLLGAPPSLARSSSSETRPPQAAARQIPTTVASTLPFTRPSFSPY